ncbi:hypothetical protein D9M72_299210 [compost metagenome]
MPRWQRMNTGSRVTSSPWKRMRPLSAATPPAMRLNSVLLPAPLGPMMPNASPGARARLRSSVTFTEP